MSDQIIQTDELLFEPGDIMTALDYVRDQQFVVINITSLANPLGIDIAWIPMETELTFDLSDVEGSIVFGDVFEAHKLWIDRLHWRFQDELGNYITRIQLRSDPDTWRTQFNEWNQPLNQEDVDDLANDMLNGEF